MTVVELHPEYALFEGKDLVGAVCFEGHVYAACVALPPFIVENPARYRDSNIIVLAKEKICRAIGDMVRRHEGQRRLN